MKEYILDIHSERCTEFALESDIHRFCEMNPERLLIFAGNQFFLLTYYRCTSVTYDRYDFIRELISEAIGKFKILELYEVRKSVDISKELKNFRMHNKQLRQYIEQVNFIYRSSSTEYAITTYTKYIDVICDRDIIIENYKKAKTFLEKKEYHYLINQLDKLLQVNDPIVYDDTEIFKTTEFLIKKIKSLIN